MTRASSARWSGEKLERRGGQASHRCEQTEPSVGTTIVRFLWDFLCAGVFIFKLFYNNFIIVLLHFVLIARYPVCVCLNQSSLIMFPAVES